ncbi:hypothetical protein P691DRAFT_783044 [Macrolepiota fuliginosa MF-IS2]|uniref:Uncharacterized protein n=1 Tax=Macrolepiota fuliginosa MF-IS2 TaxID=1400762 RepID=A0A9P5WWN5_9AGAR|nr:hypothetical protein P691DRAFT_783044 [Macrolepiota fuliginosa MF-IS2]
MHQWNAQRMYSQNNTQAFMDAKFGPDNHKFIMEKVAKRAREGWEERHWVAIQELQDADHRRGQQQVNHHATIDEQLELLRAYSGASESEIPKTKWKQGGNKSEKQERLINALTSYWLQVGLGSDTVDTVLKVEIRQLEVEHGSGCMRDTWEERDIEIEAAEEAVVVEV